MDNLEKLATLGTESTGRRERENFLQHNMYWTPLYASRDK
jgi:hypothetical protein